MYKDTNITIKLKDLQKYYKDIKDIFNEGNFSDDIVSDSSYYKCAGILNYLTILVPKSILYNKDVMEDDIISIPIESIINIYFNVKNSYENYEFDDNIKEYNKGILEFLEKFFGNELSSVNNDNIENEKIPFSIGDTVQVIKGTHKGEVYEVSSIKNKSLFGVKSNKKPYNEIYFGTNSLINKKLLNPKAKFSIGDKVLLSNSNQYYTITEIDVIDGIFYYYCVRRNMLWYENTNTNWFPEYRLIKATETRFDKIINKIKKLVKR